MVTAYRSYVFKKLIMLKKLFPIPETKPVVNKIIGFIRSTGE